MICAKFQVIITKIFWSTYMTWSETSLKRQAVSTSLCIIMQMSNNHIWVLSHIQGAQHLIRTRHLDWILKVKSIVTVWPYGLSCSVPELIVRLFTKMYLRHAQNMGKSQHRLYRGCFKLRYLLIDKLIVCVEIIYDLLGDLGAPSVSKLGVTFFLNAMILKHRVYFKTTLIFKLVSF